MTTVLHAMGTR